MDKYLFIEEKDSYGLVGFKCHSNLYCYICKQDKCPHTMFVNDNKERDEDIRTHARFPRCTFRKQLRICSSIRTAGSKTDRFTVGCKLKVRPINRKTFIPSSGTGTVFFGGTLSRKAPCYLCGWNTWYCHIGLSQRFLMRTWTPIASALELLQLPLRLVYLIRPFR